MYRKPRHWSAYAWIACLAILFNAFAPAWSGAAPGAGASPLEMEVCTAMGMEMLPMVPAGADRGGKPAKAMAHCECCMTHAAAFDLPPAPPRVFALPLGRARYPRLYYLSSRPLFPWSPAQARAPPSPA